MSHSHPWRRSSNAQGSEDNLKELEQNIKRLERLHGKTIAALASRELPKRRRKRKSESEYGQRIWASKSYYSSSKLIVHPCTKHFHAILPPTSLYYISRASCLARTDTIRSQRRVCVYWRDDISAEETVPPIDLHPGRFFQTRIREYSEPTTSRELLNILYLLIL